MIRDERGRRITARERPVESILTVDRGSRCSLYADTDYMDFPTEEHMPDKFSHLDSCRHVCLINVSGKPDTYDAEVNQR